jgi:predicted PurR-regulated permease PerM
MSVNTTDPAGGMPAHNDRPSGRQRRRKLVLAFTVLAFIALASIAIYAISLIIDAVVLLGISALLAYLIDPLVQFFQKYLKRALAIVVVYLLLAGVLATGMFIVTSSIIQQSSSLAQSVRFLLSPAGANQIQAVIDFLSRFGITPDQVAQFKQELLSQTLGALSGALPFVVGLFSNIINFIVVVTLSVSFVIDGPRIIGWLSHKTPVTQRQTITFLLHALHQSLGGYFRGSLVIALIGAMCTGVGLTLLHVPYAALMGALFFLFYFIPVIGGYVIEVLCILAAWPQGWITMVIVAIFLTVLQGIVIGQVISPRIFSKTVGIHPIVALFALFAGAELFGVLGGFFAVPAAGVLQHILVAIWLRWEHAHPEQFPPEEIPLPA